MTTEPPIDDSDPGPSGPEAIDAALDNREQVAASFAEDGGSNFEEPSANGDLDARLVKKLRNDLGNVNLWNSVAGAPGRNSTGEMRVMRSPRRCGRRGSQAPSRINVPLSALKRCGLASSAATPHAKYGAASFSMLPMAALPPDWTAWWACLLATFSSSSVLASSNNPQGADALILLRVEEPRSQRSR